MSEKEPPTLPQRLTEEQMRNYRRENFERIVKRLTVERMELLRGRVFDSEQQAADEGYVPHETGVPRETVFLDMGERLLAEHGPGNWGVTYPTIGEGDEAQMDRANLDVWVSIENVKSRIIPGTGNVLRLVVQNPSTGDSEHHIDKE